jgi:diguanylate cyclase (GGDEF)-like protein/PAS domain S-box-containing protein
MLSMTEQDPLRRHGDSFIPLRGEKASRFLRLVLMAYLPVALFVTLAEGVNAYLSERADIMRRVEDQLALVSPSLGEMMEHEDRIGLVSLAKGLAQWPGIKGLVLVDRDGATLTEENPEALTESGADGEILGWPVSHQGWLLGRVTVRFDLNGALGAALGELPGVLMNGLLKSLALVAVLVWAFRKTVTRPRLALERALAAEGGEDEKGAGLVNLVAVDGDDALLHQALRRALALPREALRASEQRRALLADELTRHRRAQRKTANDLRDVTDLVDTTVMVMKTGVDGRIEYVSERLREFTGFASDELLGKSPHVLAHADVPDVVRDEIDQTLTEGLPWVGEMKIKRRMGDSFWADVAIHVRWDTDGRRLGSMAVLEDVTARRRLETLSELDEWTGLRNRRYFVSTVDRLTREAARAGRPLSLILGDLDQFRLFNEERGQDFGDMTLRKVADVLADLAREAGGQAFRIGGDSFALLLDGAPEDRARRLAEDARAAIAALRLEQAADHLDGLPTLSLGLDHRVPGMGERGDCFRAGVEARLRLAKDLGGNRVVAEDERDGDLDKARFASPLDRLVIDPEAFGQRFIG